jgi:hypothetical protein
MDRVITSANQVADLAIGTVLRSYNGVAVLAKEGWIVSGYLYPRTHDDVEEFIGSYPLEVLHDPMRPWVPPTWGEVLAAISTNWQMDMDVVAEAVMATIWPDGWVHGDHRAFPGDLDQVSDLPFDVAGIFDRVHGEVAATLDQHLEAMDQERTRAERFFRRVPRNTLALASGALKSLTRQRDDARKKLDAVAKWRHDWLAPPKSDTYPHEPSVHIRRLDDILNTKDS